MLKKRAILTTIIIPTLLISGLIIVLVNNHREFPGALVLAEQHIDFGVLPEWEGLVTRSVTARNVGGETLHIQNVQTRCSYAKIEAPTLIQPDGEGTFQIVLNPEILPADETSVPAIIFTDSPKTPQVYLTIVAAAKRFATLSAEMCDFGHVLPNTTHQKTLRLCVNVPLNSSHPRLLPSEHPNLTWKMMPDPSTDCFLITIQLGPLKHRAFFASLLTVDFPNQRTLTLPITAKVVGPVRVQPQTLFYGAVVQGTPPSLEFTLSAKTPFEVSKVEVPPALSVSVGGRRRSAVHVDINDIDKYHQKTLEVIWHVPHPSREGFKTPIPLREEIRVLTTADALPIRIPVYGFIRREKGETNP